MSVKGSVENLSASPSCLLCSVIAAKTASVDKSVPAFEDSSSFPLSSHLGSKSELSWIHVVSRGHLVPVPSWTMFKGALRNLSMMVDFPLDCMPQITKLTNGAGRSRVSL